MATKKEVNSVNMVTMSRIASDSAGPEPVPQEVDVPEPIPERRPVHTMQLSLNSRAPAVPEDSEMGTLALQSPSAMTPSGIHPSRGILQTPTVPAPPGQLQKTESELFMFRQKSALPSMAVSSQFEWHDLNVYLGHGSKKKQILHTSDGVIQSGELLAVMGGSGAGKSTLLNALSGRTNLNQQTVEGQMAINGNKFKVSRQQIIRSLCTFVPQSDVLCATQTVEEALLFYAKLKLHHLDEKTQQKRVNFLIEVLKLNKCRKNLIGDESKRGISGGEKRRVSIAAELLNEADIIFLDEPTSGLDAYTAARTIRTLKQYCSVSNKIIIATIHQPSMEVFYLFDRLILLAAGKCCFNSYLEDINEYFRKQLRPKTNPADVTVFEVQRSPDKWAQHWTASALNTRNDVELNHNMLWEEYQTLTLQHIRKQSERIRVKSNISMPPAKLQYKLLFHREAMTYVRDRRVTVIRLVQVLAFAVVSGVIYLNVEERIDPRVQAMSLMGLIVLLCGMVSLLVVFPQQKLLFTREHSTTTYNTAPWAFALMILEIPRECLHMVLYDAIVYFMIGLAGNFGSYWVTLFLAAYSGGTFGMLIGVASETLVDAAQMVPAALIPLIVFSDMLIPIATIPIFLQWLALIDPLYFVLRCFYLIEFSDAVYTIKIKGDQKEICSQYGAFLNGTITAEQLFLAYNSSSDAVNCSNVVNDLVLTYNITDYNGYSLDDYGFEQLVLPSILDQVNGDNIIDDVVMGTTTMPPITTTAYLMNLTNTTEIQPSRQEELDVYCATHEYGNDYLTQKEIPFDALQVYWGFIVAICVVGRILAVFLLVVKNNDGFGWLAKKIKFGCLRTCRRCGGCKERGRSNISNSQDRSLDDEDRVD